MTKRRFKITQNRILFAAGLIGIGLETFYYLQFHQQPDGSLLILFSAMAGLPVYLYHDKQGQDPNDDDRGRSDPKKPQGHEE